MVRGSWPSRGALASRYNSNKPLGCTIASPDHLDGKIAREERCNRIETRGNRAHNGVCTDYLGGYRRRKVEGRRGLVPE